MPVRAPWVVALLAVIVLASSCSDDDTSVRDRDDQDAPATADTRAFPDDRGPSEAATPAATVPAELLECPPPTVAVASAGELDEALAAAAPGDVIALADGTYTGQFVATAQATEAQPIFVCGGPGAVLENEGPKSGYVFHLDGTDYWRLIGFTVRYGQKGVMADHAVGNVIQGLTVEDIGDEAIHLRAFSTDNVVRANTVRRTGLRREKFGEGVYIGSAQSNWGKYSDGGPDRSDRNVVDANTITETSSEAIDIKEGTTGGIASNNSFDGSEMTGADSWVDVKGNDWTIVGNTGSNAPTDGFQVHEVVAGWGVGNVFEANAADVNGTGFGFMIHGDQDANTVRCDNQVSDADEGIANVDCR